MRCVNRNHLSPTLGFVNNGFVNNGFINNGPGQNVNSAKIARRSQFQQIPPITTSVARLTHGLVE